MADEKFDITFQEAADDSPKFRALVHSMSHEIETFSKWAESFLITGRHYTSDCHHSYEAFVNILFSAGSSFKSNCSPGQILQVCQ
jgi:phosphoketolase